MKYESEFKKKKWKKIFKNGPCKICGRHFFKNLTTTASHAKLWFDCFLPDLGFYGCHIQANHELPIMHLETFCFTETYLGICQTCV